MISENVGVWGIVSEIPSPTYFISHKNRHINKTPKPQSSKERLESLATQCKTVNSRVSTLPASCEYYPWSGMCVGFTNFTPLSKGPIQTLWLSFRTEELTERLAFIYRHALWPTSDEVPPPSHMRSFTDHLHSNHQKWFLETAECQQHQVVVASKKLPTLWSKEQVLRPFSGNNFVNSQFR